jgi:ribonuclease P protein component
MAPGKPWLSLKVLDPATLKKPRLRKKSKPLFFISVPKKTVRLATQRNRLRRLIREAVRKDARFVGSEKIYAFKVNAFPLGVKLKDVEESLKEL